MGKNEENIKSPDIEGTLPHQINSPVFKNSGLSMQKPFVNEYGVIIGDSYYDSANSPLNQWSEDVDPAVMAGEQWVHPTNDIGWNTAENRDLVEKNIPSKGVPFMHPTKDVSRGTD
jgi:hypothetical protein